MRHYPPFEITLIYLHKHDNAGPLDIMSPERLGSDLLLLYRCENTYPVMWAACCGNLLSYITRWCLGHSLGHCCNIWEAHFTHKTTQINSISMELTDRKGVQTEKLQMSVCTAFIMAFFWQTGVCCVVLSQKNNASHVRRGSGAATVLGENILRDNFISF